MYYIYTHVCVCLACTYFSTIRTKQLYMMTQYIWRIYSYVSYEEQYLHFLRKNEHSMLS